MVIRTASSPSSSPVTITVSFGSGGKRSKGLTSPIQRPSFSNSSPISAKGRRASLSRDETEVVNLNSPVDFLAYRVDLPPTPEHTFVHSSVSASRTSVNRDSNLNVSMGGSEISKTIFTGRFDCKARGRVMERSMEASQVKKSDLVCGMEGCDESIGKGNVKCECGFRICMGCYRDCVANDGGRCPGCKEFLSKDNDGDDDYSEEDEEEAEDKALPLPSLRDTKLEKRLSVVKSFRGYAANDFDNARWLYETQGTYGYGNAHWPKDMNESDSSADWIRDFGKKCQRPLTRKISVSTAIISPYRLLILIRLVALALFLTWRIKNPNPEAIWLSFLSIACEIWFAFSWLLDQLPKLCPVNRVADTSLLKELFESPSNNNPRGLSDLPGIDVFVSTADPEKEPPLVTANTVLSILAADYPVEKIACYISDDGGSLLTFEALAEAATFAKLWVPFCRKHQIEPRNPEAYFGQKGDFLKNKVRRDFVQDRKRVKRQYDEFKVRINGLPESIRRRSEALNVRDELLAKKRFEEIEPEEPTKILKATWMEDGFHWPGTWSSPGPDHSRGDHAGIIQTMLLPASGELLFGTAPPEGPESEKSKSIDTTGVDIRLPMLVYVSREKRPGYDHNKKAGAMNALVRASAVLSNGPFILNLDCDHYIYNSQAIREGMCFMLDRGGDRICYVQFPQRFEGIDPNDRYANHNTVFFDVSMKSLDGLQGPMYVGTGCIFRRTAVYGFSPPRTTEHHGWFGTRKLKLLLKKPKEQSKKQEDQVALRIDDGQNNDDDCDASDIESMVQSRRFGSSTLLVESIPVAEYQGRLLNGIHNYKGYQGRPAGSLAVHPQPLDSSAVAEAINVISCSFEERTEWGKRVGWIYGSVTEDVVTGYRMHNRGWRSVYCVTKRDAFRGTAPINLTDRLHQVLRWATGSVEIFFSRNNALFATRRMKFLQRVAYFNVGMYPFTSIFLALYCFLPAVSLFTGHFIVQSLNVTFLLLLLIITFTLCVLSLLEIRWSGITLHDWWRNEQFWLIGGTSAHPVAVLQGLLKVLAGVEISFTLTSKSAVDEDDEFAELYEFKWTSLMYLPITIIMVNLIGITVGVTRTVYSIFPQWSKLIGGVFFSLWVLTHLYPFAKGLMGRRGKIPTIVFLWSGLISIIFSMFWVYGFSGDQTFWKFQFP